MSRKRSLRVYVRRLRNRLLRDKHREWRRRHPAQMEEKRRKEEERRRKRKEAMKAQVIPS